MKNKFICILSGLLLSACSQKVATSGHPAMELIEVGKDVRWGENYVLRVAKRAGNSIEGVRLVQTAGGKEGTLTADTGTVLPGPDSSSVKLVLRKGQWESATTKATFDETEVVLHR